MQNNQTIHSDCATVAYTEHGVIPALYVDKAGKSSILDAEGNALHDNWTGICCDSKNIHRFWFIGNEKGERSFTALQAKNLTDARQEIAQIQRSFAAIWARKSEAWRYLLMAEADAIPGGYTEDVPPPIRLDIRSKMRSLAESGWEPDWAKAVQYFEVNDTMCMHHLMLAQAKAAEGLSACRLAQIPSAESLRREKTKLEAEYRQDVADGVPHFERRAAVTDPIITPFVRAVVADGWQIKRRIGGCDELGTCPKCKSRYLYTFFKDGEVIQLCPHCRNTTDKAAGR